MKISKFARIVLVPSIATLALAGAAFASSVDVTSPGPDSHNDVTVTNSNNVDVHNDNNVTVTNNNTQTATSGDVNVHENTTFGDASSGSASNRNSFNTSIQIGNESLSGGGNGSGNGGGGNGGNGNGGGGTGGGSLSSSSNGGKGGGSLGMGGGTLPETGASIPVDVSALRNLLNPTSQSTPLSQALQSNRKLSAGLLAAGAILSLMGAIASAVYSTKRTLKV